VTFKLAVRAFLPLHPPSFVEREIRGRADARCCVDRSGKAIKKAPRERSVAWEGLVEPLSRVALTWRPRSHHKLVNVVVEAIVKAVYVA
jgi:hypothetical protein